MIRVRMVPASPFVRKCRIAAAHLGLGDRVEFVDAHADSDDALRKKNPLNKIPVAVLDDGAVIYDSVVIVEYFDHLAGGGKIIPVEPGARFRALSLQALADGVMDAAILIAYEARYREPHQHSPRWLAHQQTKIDAALDVLEAAPPSPDINAGEIALACALGFLDLRLGGTWREGRPRLARWLQDFAARVPSFEATRATK